MKRLVFLAALLCWPALAWAQGDQQAPTQPSGPTIFAPGSSGIDLGWGISTDNVGVTAYLVERCAGSACSSFSQIGSTTTELTYADRGLTPDAIYRYRVRARDAAGNFSTYTAILEARTRHQTPTLTWTDNSEASNPATSFIISRRDACGTGTYTDVATVDASITSWTDTTTQAQMMEYRVRAADADGESDNATSVCWLKERTVGARFTGREKTVPAVGLRQR